MADLLVLAQPSNSLVYSGGPGGSLTYGGAIPQTLQLAAIPPASISILAPAYQLTAAAEQGPEGVPGGAGAPGPQGPPGTLELNSGSIVDGGFF